MPIRGRYVSLSIVAQARGFPAGAIYGSARLSVEDGNPGRATRFEGGNMVTHSVMSRVHPDPADRLLHPRAHPRPIAPSARRRAVGRSDRPPKGPPRPIQLGVKKDGVLTPLP